MATERSLVLNATHEPICVVTGRRAAVLVLAEKADVVHGTGRHLRSERLSVPVPSVIRLRYYVKVPYHRRAALSRRAVFIRDDQRCQYCEGSADSIDHVVPRSRGGEHIWENVVASCRRCNLAKRDRLLSETSMDLRTPPRAPRELTWLVVKMGRVPTHWEPYLGVAAMSA